MTVITGWRNRKPAPSKAFSADPAFSGTNLKNAQRSTEANDRKGILSSDSISTETISPTDKRARLSKASI